MHLILYGEPKTGKTSTLDDPKYRVLVGDLEGGTAVLEDAQNVDRIPIETWEDLIEFGASIKRGYFLINGEKIPCDYDLIAIDSITRVQDMCKEYIATKHAPNRSREVKGFFGTQGDWGDLRTLLTGMVKSFHNLTKRGSDSVHLMWIAHKGVNKDDVSKAVTSTKINLQGSDTAEIIMSYVDGLFYMVKRRNENGETEYGILTNTRGVYVAGVRQSKKREPLPEFIVNPVWSDIIEKLGYVRM